VDELGVMLWRPPVSPVETYVITTERLKIVRIVSCDIENFA
jgi:hypothetical protein